MKKLWRKLKKRITKIGLVDRFLILFMFILLLYTAISLFTGITDSPNGDMVDTIIRTSAASIFGYFISSNFVKINTTNSVADSDSQDLNSSTQAYEENLEVQPNNQNEFLTSAEGIEEQAASPVPEISPNPIPCNKLQVAIVSTIGGCALILLFITKFLIPKAADVSATISQLRDFVSACIGFLVSYGRAK